MAWDLFRRNAIGAVIQGTEADIFKMALARLNHELPPDYHLLLPIHDAVLVEVPRARIDDATRVVRQVMETPPADFDVPLTVDVHFGQSWGKCERQPRSLWPRKRHHS